MRDCYDIIVVGAGHAGCEAAVVSAKLGNSVLLITMNLALVAQMSCNPAIGGIAKGQIVREIDALGGMTGIVTDHTMIQYRMLNRSKGPAMWSPRAQCDKTAFSLYWKHILENTPNLHLRQDTVTELLFDADRVIGVKTQLGKTVLSKKVILTNGTFLNGRIHVGEVNFSGGRIGESDSFILSHQLKGKSVASLRKNSKPEPLSALMDGLSISPKWKNNPVKTIRDVFRSPILLLFTGSSVAGLPTPTSKYTKYSKRVSKSPLCSRDASKVWVPVIVRP